MPSISPDAMADVESPSDTEVDAHLIEAWRRGDERAAASLVARHAQALHRFALRLGMGAEAEDLVQDTFIKAFGALDTFRADSSLRTWLFTIERRLVIDRQRASGRRGMQVEVEDTHAVSSATPLDGLLAAEASEQIQRALATLTPMQRAVFTLRVQEGQNYRDIAAILGSTEGAARVHYHNAMRAVKEVLDA